MVLFTNGEISRVGAKKNGQKNARNADEDRLAWQQSHPTGWAGWSQRLHDPSPRGRSNEGHRCVGSRTTKGHSPVMGTTAPTTHPPTGDFRTFPSSTKLARQKAHWRTMMKAVALAHDCQRYTHQALMGAPPVAKASVASQVALVRTPVWAPRQSPSGHQICVWSR